MAMVIDASGERDPMPGEARTFIFAGRALASRPDAIVILSRFTGTRELDVLVVDPEIGLVNLEVKDWEKPRSIAEAGPRGIRFWKKGGGQTNWKNPADQARTAARDIHGELRERLGFHPRAVQYGFGLVLPFFSEQDFRAAGLETPFQRHIVLLKDDLDPAGPLAGKNGNALVARLKRLSGQTKRIDPQLFGRIRSALTRSVVLPRSPTAGRTQFEERVAYLIGAQRRAAWKIGTGDVLVRGGHGTGKSLIVVQRACELAAEEPDCKVALVCYSIAGAAHLRNLVLAQRTGLGVGGGRIAIRLLDDFVEGVLGGPMECARDDRDAYARSRAEACARLESGAVPGELFDTLIVDEAQDIDDVMMRTIAHHRAPGGTIAVALDERQAVFDRVGDWRKGLDGQPWEVIELRENLRSTTTLQSFLAHLLDDPAPPPRRDKTPEPAPRLLPADSRAAAVDAIAAEVRARVIDDEIAPRDVAVLYQDKVYDDDGFRYGALSIAEQIAERIEAQGIPARWVSRDRFAKESYDPSTNRVSVLSYHSAKGLDWSTVYVLDVDRLDEDSSRGSQLEALLRVAFSRARYELVIPHSRETPTIRRVDAAIAALRTDEQPAADGATQQE